MQQISKPTFIDISLVLLTALIWASAFTFIKIAVVETGPLMLAAYRVIIGFLVLLPICLYLGFAFPKGRKAWLILVGIVLFNIVLPFSMISWAQQYIKASETSLLLGATPFMSMILAHFATSDENINRYKIIAVILGIIGVLIVLGAPVLSGVAQAPILPMLAIVISGFCYVTAGLLTRRVKIGPIQFTTIAFAIAALIHITLALSIEGMPQELPSTTVTLAIIWLGLFPTGLAYILRFVLVKRIGFSTFALGQNMIPVFGVIIAAVILSEAITPAMIIALLLVVAGQFIARLTPKQKN